MNIYTALEQAGLPVPITQCQACGGTIWRKDCRFQCPGCGARSTAFGGTFPALSPSGEDAGASKEWIEACAQAKKMLEQAKGQLAESAFTDELYAILRNYQEGVYHIENRCVVVERLDAALTAVYDEVRAAYRRQSPAGRGEGGRQA